MWPGWTDTRRQAYRWTYTHICKRREALASRWYMWLQIDGNHDLTRLPNKLSSPQRASSPTVRDSSINTSTMRQCSSQTMISTASASYNIIQCLPSRVYAMFSPSLSKMTICDNFRLSMTILSDNFAPSICLPSRVYAMFSSSLSKMTICDNFRLSMTILSDNFAPSIMTICDSFTLYSRLA